MYTLPCIVPSVPCNWAVINPTTRPRVHNYYTRPSAPWSAWHMCWKIIHSMSTWVFLKCPNANTNETYIPVEKTFKHNIKKRTVVGSSWKEWSSVLANSIVRSHLDHHTCHVLLRIILLHIFFISFAELVISCLPSSCLCVCTCLQWTSFPSWFFWVRLSIESLL